MSFIFNGVSSDTMKFNVTSRQVYNAPAYDLNAIEVPGRSGDLLSPQNRFKNKQISYTGFLKASDFEGSTWREKLSTGLIQLKGWLCSDAGTYHELTDDYDPGFMRYGYISGETAISDVQDRPFGVTLTVTFNCKPYMYKAGEPIELPETKSASGSIITITDGADNTPLKSCVVNIEPVQDLHGYDYPWPAGGGKNLLVPTVRTVTSKGITYTANADGSISLSGTATGDENFTIVQNTSDQWAGPVSALALGGKTGIYFTFGGIDVATNGGTQTLTTNVNISGLRIKVTSGTVTNVTVKVQVESGSTAPTQWTPYSNICPISGWTQVNVWVKPTYDTSLTPTATIPLGRTVYGGTLDVVSGKLVIDKAAHIFDGTEVFGGDGSANAIVPRWNETIPGTSYTGYVISNMLKTVNSYTTIRRSSGVTLNSNRILMNPYATVYANSPAAVTAIKTFCEEQYANGTPLTVCYELATPIEVDLTPQHIKTLLGTNNIWSDAGDMEIEYPIPTENPYPFGSRPLYEITMAGTGTLVVNGREWTITDYTGTLYCDTEAMEWYDASQLRNNIVSGDGWPVLEAGENSVSYTGDITKVMVTPRWRTL